ncbi:DUF6265 family protein [Flavobacterium paronense]|uniref:DUF6265 family protein n=1 Tax=Flavobacterium paronense TaxID=1392775 RepID=A0ABV5GGS3_9FLAO|nr:DUF6265 family protein [Flavobacterium paronense]MDN3677203.1 DUF6265 family protein [Flavobacterium paronense]
MKTTLAILSIALLISCQNKSEKKFDKLEKMNWLIGNWEQKLPDGTLKEAWTKQNDSTFSGKSFFINTKDTVHFESIKLTQSAEELKYIATVVGQNNDDPIVFELTSDVDNAFTFENPTHDYPQKITYKKVNESNMLASISGKQQGKLSSESYSMTKK